MAAVRHPGAMVGRGGVTGGAARRFLVPLVLVAAIAAPQAAAAQSLSPATVTVEDFAGVTLDGTAKSTTAGMSNFSVTDSAGAGWHVTVSATRFAEVDGAGQYVSEGKTLPAGSLTMPAPTVSPQTALVTVTSGPYALDGASLKIISAAPATTGTFDVVQSGSLTLAVPGSAYARTYRSEVTVAVASGP